MTTIVSLILDRSGSMADIKKSTIDGVNEYINSLKLQKNILFSLTTFDTVSTETPYVLTSISHVSGLTDETYQPRGGTPLYDAAVVAIEKLADQVEKMDKKPAVLVAIMTDGLENASFKHDEKCLQKLIKSLEEKGNWTFIYLGANQDSFAVASKFGISRGNTLNWAGTNLGMRSVMQDMANQTADYAMAMSASVGSSDLSSKNFFDTSKK